MAKKRIEEINREITSADDMLGNELFIVSAQDNLSENGWSTKKIGIQALKDYVLDGSDGEQPVVVNNQNITITQNGTYEIDSSSGYTGYNPITVNVPKSRVIFGHDDSSSTFKVDGTYGDYLCLNHIPIQSSDNSDITLYGISISNTGKRYVEQCSNVSYHLKGYFNSGTGYRTLYCYIATGSNDDYWHAGDLVVTHHESIPTSTEQYLVAFAPVTGLTIEINPGQNNNKTATVVNKSWRISNS